MSLFRRKIHLPIIINSRSNRGDDSPHSFDLIHRDDWEKAVDDLAIFLRENPRLQSSSYGKIPTLADRSAARQIIERVQDSVRA